MTLKTPNPNFKVTPLSKKQDYHSIYSGLQQRRAVRNKKLSCHIEASRRFVSLNISLSFKVTQGHWKWHHSPDRVRVPIGVPQ